MDDLGLTIHFLGTGSTSPNAHRDNSSLLFVMGKRAVMVDASGYPGRKLPQAGVSFDQLTDLVLTHAHIDHIYAYPSLIASIVSASGEKRPTLNVHARPSVLDVAWKLLAPFSEPGRTATRLQLNYVTLPQTLYPLEIDFGAWQLSSFPVSHGGVSAIGLVLEHDSGARVVYSGDAEADHHIAEQLTDQTLCLIQDCASGMRGTPRTAGHAGAEELKSLLKTVPHPKQVILTHLSARQDPLLPDMLVLLRDGFCGEVTAAYDGMKLVF
jgi:ribonuclease Z